MKIRTSRLLGIFLTKVCFMLFDLEVIKRLYADFANRVQLARSVANKPLTLTEKILYAHAAQFSHGSQDRSGSYMELYPDRVAMHDISAQTILLQYASSQNRYTSVPASLHCDHLIMANKGTKEDLLLALRDDKEVFDFLENASRKFNIDFWKPGSGIIHQILLENYVFPGGILLGGDAHMAHAGGMAMLGIGAGESDIVEVMAGLTWEMKFPKVIGIKLTGHLKGWSSPKDVILHLAGTLNPNGAIIEYFGEGIKSISTSGRAAICNLGAELGAVSSLFPYDSRTADYLKATGREALIELAAGISDELKDDREIEEHPDLYFDQVMALNLSDLEPTINGPFSIEKEVKLANLAESIHKNSYPDKISAAFIGSCSHSSYEDFDRVADLARQALKHSLKAKCPLYITLGSEQVKTALTRQGILKILEEAGAIVLANCCGPCGGQWKRQDVNFGEKNSIISSYNRNTAGRNDGNPGTHSFLASPEIVMALALAGTMTFNPTVDLLFNQEGLPVKLHPPGGSEFPPHGFIQEDLEDVIPASNEKDIPLFINPDSQRLQLISPFPAWKGKDFEELRVLAKVKGKCTIDHISPTGKWLRFRGHLDRLSDNFLAGAANAYRPLNGKGKNALTGDIDPFSKVARAYKTQDIDWIVIGEENYGEGPVRELAAIQFRYLGGTALIAKSFCREYETHLKKQGILALVFANSADYDKIQEDDLIFIEGLQGFSPGIPLTLLIQHTNKIRDIFLVHHSYTSSQVEWFKAGGVLNRQACLL
jgi:aconitate hydratase